mmetsp:Transcript_22472/g.34467  ORF Transcript_22472/g.34467 Transcript_22472/m.34467 type:complete len:615 (+) Transcript_22472:31-1875(+)
MKKREGTAEAATKLKTLLKSKPSNDNEDASRLDEIRRIFQSLYSDLAAAASATTNDTTNNQGTGAAHQQLEDKWTSWLQKQHKNFVKQICKRIYPNSNSTIKSKGGASKRYALRVFFGALAYFPASDATVRMAGNNNNNNVRYSFMNEDIMYRLVYAMCGAGDSSGDDNSVGRIDESMLTMLQSEFLRPYHDVRYFMLLAIHRLAVDLEEQQNHDGVNGVVVENMMRILLCIEIAADGAELCDADLFLVRPPASAAATVGDRNDDHEDNDSDDDESDDDSEAERDSDSDSDSDNDDSNKRKAAADSAMTSRKRSRRDNELPFVQRLSKHRRVLSQAWLYILQINTAPGSSNKAVHKRALQHLPKHVIPHMHAPLRLADYLTAAYSSDGGGVMSLLALHGLFILMTEYNLEYPKFYSSLYALIKPAAFYARYRTRFLRLLNSCLMSSYMLPGHIVAAFCKRLCRTALIGIPPSGVLFVLSLVSNLVRKHPVCRCLVYRKAGDESDVMDDVFDAGCDDPEECRALESSLWELSALEKHYHPSVSSLAKTCGKEDNKSPLYDLNEFVSLTYKSLFDQELNEKKLAKKGASSKVTPLAFHEPKGLFPEDDIFSEIIKF